MKFRKILGGDASSINIYYFINSECFEIWNSGNSDHMGYSDSCGSNSSIRSYSFSVIKNASGAAGGDTDGSHKENAGIVSE